MTGGDDRRRKEDSSDGSIRKTEGTLARFSRRLKKHTEFLFSKLWREPEPARSRKTHYIEEDRRVEDDNENEDLPADVDADSAQKTDMTGNRARWALAVARRKLRPLVKEFSENRKYFPNDVSTSTFQMNTAKNRYEDVYCADHSRVILKNREEDYIHASWVVIPNSSQRYICTQGPLEETLEDFWHMIVQERVPIIVMLCSVVEGGTEKCAQYWPLAPGEAYRFGNITVRNEKVVIMTSIEMIRCTTLEVETKCERFNVTHYQWADWPDHLVPNDAKSAVDLLKLCKQTCDKRPVVVHCSAGIGRTGTFCGIDYAAERIKVNPRLSMVDIMKEMRQQRVHCIQTTLQYLFLHACVFEYFIKSGQVKPDASIKAFMKEYEKYLNKFKTRAAVREKE